MNYFDKNGNQIKAGMDIRMADGSIEQVKQPMPMAIPTLVSMPPMRNTSKDIPMPAESITPCATST